MKQVLGQQDLLRKKKSLCLPPTAGDELEGVVLQQPGPDVDQVPVLLLPAAVDEFGDVPQLRQGQPDLDPGPERLPEVQGVGQVDGGGAHRLRLRRQGAALGARQDLLGQLVQLPGVLAPAEDEREPHVLPDVQKVLEPEPLQLVEERHHPGDEDADVPLHPGREGLRQ